MDRSRKVPVLDGAAEYSEFMHRHPGYWVMGYIGEKTPQEWDGSSSRRHMNELWPDEFLYVPINVAQGDDAELERIYTVAKNAGERAIGFNQTNPHKSNMVMRRMFEDRIGDILIREDGVLRVRDANGAGGARLLLELLGTDDFSGISVVVVGGLGASGRLIGEACLAGGASRLIIVDVNDDDEYVSRLGRQNPDCSVSSAHDLGAAASLEGRIAFVNATRHQNARTGESISERLQAAGKDIAGNATLDLLLGFDAQLESLAMPHAGGDIYVAYTNHMMCTMIAKATGLPEISFEDFSRIVHS